MKFAYIPEYCRHNNVQSSKKLSTNTIINLLSCYLSATDTIFAMTALCYLLIHIQQEKSLLKKCLLSSNPVNMTDKASDLMVIQLIQYNSNFKFIHIFHYAKCCWILNRFLESDTAFNVLTHISASSYNILDEEGPVLLCLPSNDVLLY